MSAFPPHAYERSAYGGGTLSLIPISFARSGYSGAVEPRDAIIKRTIDIGLALLGLAITGIPMLLIAAAIRLTSKGPALFRQERIGLNGRRFVMLKFRTMHHGITESGPFHQATRHDPRVTRVGAVLRHT